MQVIILQETTIVIKLCPSNKWVLKKEGPESDKNSRMTLSNLKVIENGASLYLRYIMNHSKKKKEKKTETNIVNQ